MKFSKKEIFLRQDIHKANKCSKTIPPRLAIRDKKTYAGENVGKESHLVTNGRNANVIANMEITVGGSSKTEN